MRGYIEKPSIAQTGKDPITLARTALDTANQNVSYTAPVVVDLVLYFLERENDFLRQLLQEKNK